MKKIDTMSYVVNQDIELKLCEFSDAEDLFALIEANRLHLRRWMGWLDLNMSIEDSLDYIRNSVCSFMQGTRYSFGIFYRDELVGVIALTQLMGEVNLGYWIVEQHQGKGIVTTCARFITEVAFTEFGVNRLIIRCATENYRSRAVPERLGYVYEGTARQAEWLYDHFVDLEVYSFVRSDFVN